MERVRAQPSAWERWEKFREENPERACAIADVATRFYARFTDIMAAAPKRPLIGLIESGEFAELVATLDADACRALGIPVNGKRLGAIRWATSLAFALLTHAEANAS